MNGSDHLRARTMTIGLRASKPSKPERGVSLVELMVALALGVVLVLGLVQIFGSVRASFAAAEGLSRRQENSRFAMEFLRRDLRMASHLGCRSEYQLIDVPGRRGFYNHFVSNTAATVAAYDTAPYPYRLHDALEVYDYSAGGGTSPSNTLAAELAEFPSGVTAANAFTPALPNVLTTPATLNIGATGILGNDVGDVVPGSDIVIVRYLGERGVTLPQAIRQDTGALVGTNVADFPRWKVFGVSNCAAVALFQSTSASSPATAVVSGSTYLNLQSWGFQNEPIFAGGAEVYPYEFVMYHIGRTGADTGPALFRRRLLAEPTNAATSVYLGQPEELVPNVEMMQVLLGVDTGKDASRISCTATPTTTDTADDQVDAYCSAAQRLAGSPTRQQVFDRMRSVKTLRISLLMRSPDRLPSTAAPASRVMVVGDVRVTVPDDRRLRQVYESTITLRNRVRN